MSYSPINEFHPEISNSRNLLNNPAFMIAQQGNAFSQATSATVPLINRLDDWVVTGNGTGGTVNYGRLAVTYPTAYGVLPNNPSWYGYMQIATLGTLQQYIFMAQKLEDVRILAGRQVVLSGWVNSTIALPASASNGVNLKLRCDNAYGSGASTGSTLGTEVAIDVPVANTWTYFEVASSFPSIPAGLTLGANHNNMMYIVDWNMSLHTVNLANLQLEIGTSASKFNQESYNTQLLKAMRSYQQSFSYGVAPVQNSGSVVGAYTFSTSAAGAVVSYGPSQSFLVPMRYLPTVTLYNPNAANAQLRNAITSTDATGTVIGGPCSEKQLVIQGTGLAAWAVNQRLSVHWSAYSYLA